MEAWLEAWGAERRNPIPQLYYPSQSTIQTMRDLSPPRRSLTSRLSEVLKWRKNPSQTGHSGPKIPNYTRKPRYDLLNRLIHALPPNQYAIIVMRYEMGWTHQMAKEQIGMPKSSYFRVLKQAKKTLKSGTG